MTAYRCAGQNGRGCPHAARWLITAHGHGGKQEAHACDHCQPVLTRQAARYGTPAVEQLANAPPPQTADTQLDLFTT